MKLLDAAKVFSIDIPTWLADHVEVGSIAGIPVYAGEVRRLQEAILAEEEEVFSSADQEVLDVLRTGRLIEAIRVRRNQVNESLKASKDYVEALGQRDGLRELGVENTYTYWFWTDKARALGIAE